MTLFLATSNPWKVEDFTRVFGRHHILFTVKSYDEPEPQAETVDEVVRWKAKYAHRRLREAVVATDFCVHFDALNGFPGPGLKLVQKQLGLDGLLKTLRKLDSAGRINGHEGYACRFVTAVAYKDEYDKEPRVYSHAIPGVLDPSLYDQLRLGRDGWLEKLFKPEAAAMPIGLMTQRQYQDWRASAECERAHVQLARWIVDNRPGLRCYPPTER